MDELYLVVSVSGGVIGEYHACATEFAAQEFVRKHVIADFDLNDDDVDIIKVELPSLAMTRCLSFDEVETWVNEQEANDA